MGGDACCRPRVRLFGSSLLAGLLTAMTSFSGPTLAQEPDDLILTTADGWPIHVSYYNAKRGQASKENSVVVLLTAANGDKAGVTRRVWTDLAAHLQRNKFVVLTVDLRKHGDSSAENGNNNVRASDYRDMVMGDMEAVKAFLLERHEAQELNIRKLGVVASGASTAVAASFAWNDWSKPPYPDAPTLAARTPRGQDVRAIAMISPRRAKGINTTKVLKPLADPRLRIAFRIYHSARKQDEAEQQLASQIYGVVRLRGEEYADLRSIEAKNASAEGFLSGKMGEYFQTDLTRFLQTNLDSLVSPWATRVSRLDR